MRVQVLPVFQVLVEPLIGSLVVEEVVEVRVAFHPQPQEVDLVVLLQAVVMEQLVLRQSFQPHPVVLLELMQLVEAVVAQKALHPKLVVPVVPVS